MAAAGWQPASLAHPLQAASLPLSLQIERCSALHGGSSASLRQGQYLERKATYTYDSNLSLSLVLREAFVRQADLAASPLATHGSRLMYGDMPDGVKITEHISTLQVTDAQLKRWVVCRTLGHSGLFADSFGGLVSPCGLVHSGNPARLSPRWNLGCKQSPGHQFQMSTFVHALLRCRTSTAKLFSKPSCCTVGPAARRRSRCCTPHSATTWCTSRASSSWRPCCGAASTRGRATSVAGRAPAACFGPS